MGKKSAKPVKAEAPPSPRESSERAVRLPRPPTTTKCVHGKTLDRECPECAALPLSADEGVTRVVRAVRKGNNDYTILEETYCSRPVAVRVLKEGSARVPAEDRVRLYNEEWLGLNRFGDSGL